MDDLLDFLNPNKPILRKTISSGTSGDGWTTEVKSDAEQPSAKQNDEFQDIDEYAHFYIEENNQLLLKVYDEVLVC